MSEIELNPAVQPTDANTIQPGNDYGQPANPWIEVSQSSFVPTESGRPSDNQEFFTAAPLRESLEPREQTTVRNADGTTTTSHLDGRVITRDPVPDNGQWNQVGRITSATTQSGDTISYGYENADSQTPNSVSFGGQTYTIGQNADLISLDHVTGTAQVSGLDGKGRPWSITHQMNGDITRRLDNEETTTTRNRLRETSTTTAPDLSRSVVRETNRTTGQWDETSRTFTGANNEVLNLTQSWGRPAGQMTPIPGLNLDQINRLRQADGQAPLPANTPLAQQVYSAQVTTRQEHFDAPSGNRYITFTTSTGQHFHSTLDMQNGGGMYTQSPLDPGKK